MLSQAVVIAQSGSSELKDCFGARAVIPEFLSALDAFVHFFHEGFHACRGEWKPRLPISRIVHSGEVVCKEGNGFVEHFARIFFLTVLGRQPDSLSFQTHLSEHFVGFAFPNCRGPVYVLVPSFIWILSNSPSGFMGTFQPMGKIKDRNESRKVPLVNSPIVCQTITDEGRFLGGEETSGIRFGFHHSTERITAAQ